jgi:ABC-type glycerol-3-phosphate transport system substrate-binding protein
MKVGEQGEQGSLPAVASGESRDVRDGRSVATRRRLLGGALSAGVAGLLAACQGPGGTPTPAEVEGRVTLWYLSQFRFDTGIGGEIVKETMAQNPKLQVVPEEISGDRVEKLKVAAAAGSAPDIGQAGAWQMQEFGALGIAAPVDPYLKASRAIKQTDVWPTLLYDLTWKNQVYGMPFGPDIAVMWIQANLARSVGIDPNAPPQTWDQLEQHIGRIYRAEPPRVGYHPLQGSGGARAMFVLTYTQLGGQLLSADGTKATFNNELGLRALDWMTKVCNAQGGYAALQSATSNGNIAAGFANGTVGYMFESSDQQVRDVFKNASGLQYTVAAAPIPPGGRRASLGGCHSFCITKQSKAPEGAWKFLETLSSEQNNLRFALEFNRIPIRVATSRSAAFHQNDPIKKLAGEQMEFRRWLIPAPGGTEAAALYNTLGPDVVTGKVAARDALAETERLVQQALDKWK